MYGFVLMGMSLEAGGEVPLVGGFRGTLVQLHSRLAVMADLMLVRWDGGVSEVDMNTGLFRPMPAGSCTGIDVEALRVERAPKPATHFGFTHRLPDGAVVPRMGWPALLDAPKMAGESQCWVHRDGASEQEWRRFFTALERYVSLPLGYPSAAEIEALRNTAKALGFGGK